MVDPEKKLGPVAGALVTATSLPSQTAPAPSSIQPSLLDVPVVAKIERAVIAPAGPPSDPNIFRRASEDKRISHGSHRLWANLRTRMADDSSVRHEWARVDSLADRIGAKRESIMRWLLELVQTGWLRRLFAGPNKPHILVVCDGYGNKAPKTGRTEHQSEIPLPPHLVISGSPQMGTATGEVQNSVVPKTVPTQSPNGDPGSPEKGTAAYSKKEIEKERERKPLPTEHWQVEKDLRMLREIKARYGRPPYGPAASEAVHRLNKEIAELEAQHIKIAPAATRTFPRTEQAQPVKPISNTVQEMTKGFEELRKAAGA